MTRSCSSDIFASDKWYPFLELTSPEKYFEAIVGKYPHRILPLSHIPLCTHTHTLLSLLTILTFASLSVLRIFSHWPFNNNNNSFIITWNKGEFLQSFSQKKRKKKKFLHKMMQYDKGMARNKINKLSWRVGLRSNNIQFWVPLFPLPSGFTPAPNPSKPARILDKYWPIS